jgi:choline dehydrogenase-like flavoprotein
MYTVPHAGTARMSSSGGAPFTLTIMANALRVASRIVARASQGEL